MFVTLIKKFILCLVAAVASAAAAREIPVVAHRGLSGVAPENTLAAYRAAWQNGVKYIEIDVYQTLDHQIVCCHDRDLARVSPGADKKNSELRKLTLAEVKKYDVGSWKGKQFAGEKIPTLEELFAELPADERIFLEIKSVEPDFPLRLVELMKKYHISKERIIVISFSGAALKNLNRLAPGFKTYLLLSIRRQKDHPELPLLSPEEVIARLKNFGVSGVDAGGVQAVDAAYIKKVKEAGFEFHVWTIDRPEAAVRLRDAGVDSITTNRPVSIRKALRK